MEQQELHARHAPNTHAKDAGHPETPQQAQQRVSVERHAEHAALQLIRGTSFKHALQLSHLATERTVTTDDGKKHRVRGQDLVNRATWSHFLAEHEVPLSWLSYQAGTIATSYARWLCTRHTRRYRAIAGQEEMTWLEQVARLAVIWHLMLHKQNTHEFLDPWVESEMGKILLLRSYSQEMARAVYHGRKDPEQAATLLETAYEHALSLIADRTFVPYEAPIAPPPGTPDPLALPATHEGPAHEPDEPDA